VSVDMTYYSSIIASVIMCAVASRTRYPVTCRSSRLHAQVSAQGRKEPTDQKGHCRVYALHTQKCKQNQKEG